MHEHNTQKSSKRDKIVINFLIFFVRFQLWQKLRKCALGCAKSNINPAKCRRATKMARIGSKLAQHGSNEPAFTALALYNVLWKQAIVLRRSSLRIDIKGKILGGANFCLKPVGIDNNADFTMFCPPKAYIKPTAIYDFCW